MKRFCVNTALLLIVNVMFSNGENIRSKKHTWQEDILDPKKYLQQIYEYYVAGTLLKF